MSAVVSKIIQKQYDVSLPLDARLSCFFQEELVGGFLFEFCGILINSSVWKDGKKTASFFSLGFEYLLQKPAQWGFYIALDGWGITFNAPSYNS